MTISCPPQVLTKRQRALFLPLCEQGRRYDDLDPPDGRLMVDDEITDPVLERAIREGVCDACE